CLDALAARLCEPARTASLLLTAGPVALVLGLAGALAPQFLASTPQGSVASVLVLALTVTAYLTVVGTLLGAHSARHALPVPSRSPAPRERGRLRGLLLGDWGRLAGQTALVLAVAMTVTASPAGSVALAADPDAQPRLALVVTGSGPEPLLTAELYPAGGSTVPLSGSVQFLDGDGPLGDPVALVAPDPDGASRVTLRPTLAEGRHGFAFVFLPDVSDFDLGYSNGVEYTVGTPPPAPTQGTEPVTVTATATGADGGPLVTGQPADVTVVVTPDAATATAAVTGSVTVTLGSSSFQVVEIGRQGSGPAGTTTVRVDPLDGTQLEARYAGDTVYAPGTASTTLTPGAGPVPAEVVRPVAMTASVLNPESSRIGDPVSVQVRVGPEGAVPPGSGPPTGEVLVSQVLPGDDGVVGDPRDSAKVVRARGRLTDGYVLLAVPTDELPVGALTLYVQFLGEAPWGGATATLTLTLDKASTYVTLVDSTPALGSTLVWGTPHTVRARVTSAVDGPRTLLVRQLVAGSLVTRRSVDVTLAGGTVTAPVDLTGALSPVAGADSEFVLEVAATDRAGAAATGDASGEQPLFPVRVLPAPLRLTVTSTPAVPRPGQSVTVDVRAVDATSGLPVAVSGRVVVARGTDGSGGAVDYPSSTPAGDGFTATFTAPAFLSGEGATADANTLLVSVTAGERPPGRLGEQVAHTAAAGSLLLVLTREAGPAPVVAWGTPRPAFAGGTEVPLTLTYPAPDGGAPVTGGVEVRTAGGVVVATTALVGGVGRTVVPVGAGDELVAAYLGDATYAPRTDLLPDPPGSLVFRPVAVLVASGSTTAVGSDPAGDVAAPTPATLTVADGEQVRFGGRVSGIPAGRVATLRVVGTGPAGAVDLGAASGDPVVLPPGTYLLRLVATFTPGDGATVDVAPVMSGPVTVVVSPPVAPLVTLTSLTAQPYAGAAARLRVRAQAPAGTRLSVS
ncbi:MAG: hypothetical protein JWO60_3209, partial [Frankiales bacterium]|nr:hypothetical protein [Frankiales bacterium]